jgi:serine/threonine protein kinase HipA of HipAB toxin-antitoxin module
MNANTSNHSHAKRASHAHFSAAGHGAASIYDTATHQPAFAINQSTAHEDLFSQFWTPGLLDRLQAPLTRYRE